MKNDFSRIKRKIFFEVITIIIGTFLVGFIFYKVVIMGLLHKTIADAIVEVAQSLFGMDYYVAAELYRQIFTYNKTFIIGSFCSVLVIIMLYFIILRFTSYFNQISKGVNELLLESEDPILMSPELEFMSKQLNEVKQTLMRREKVARESEQRKNDLVMYLAHDIKTPLTSVIGYLTLLNEAPDLPIEQRQKYTEICLDKSYRLELLMNEFFEITRFNLHQIILEKEIINLTFMFEQLVDEFYPNLLDKQLEIQLIYSENIECYGDVDKLARVFNNLLKNAVVYCYPKSTIEVCLIKQQQSIEIVFKNHGKIIPKQKLNTIFEKFYRLDSARTSNTGGSGLGLAISKEIIEAHEGTISATSDESGTVFKISLPQP
ncbi:GHKL domain-containing protein [Turicibacter sanguinis]|uniref:sensor histidine kinase n=1 Tax=Turicibacter sanguinis TaxID=154288 RepID=UPI0012BCE8AF|nr:HAMP domain-containing sensor histidine kinase [Turicibacter sanguinis]MDB8460071.1 HAMP domain-containing sensor histidine kinase [Turicibacter sanguinis]MTN46132.1 GHKL domain-containing protein [Turicibacter sanguinis]MTN51974.1 GHKL domain-containing protein [Turicibacter sanguinis]MTN55023.1 GHKL domain-containing protein [Turicibacter sanguinis]MTN58239.1 GHKL domain-containing protein [Turicibacter sanguinis]